MSLLLPRALWALWLVPPVIALVLWRAARREVTVPSLIIWRRVTQHTAAPTRSRNWRVTAAVILAGLFTAAAVLALSRPIIAATGTVGRHVVVILDASASMWTVNPGGSARWQQAQRQLRTAFDDLDSSDRVSVFVFPSAGADLIADRVSPNEAWRAIAAVEPTDAPGDALCALATAMAATDARGRALILCTDSAPWAQAPARPEGLIAILVGGPAENDGIVAFEVAPTRDKVFAAVRRFGGERGRREIEFVVGGVVNEKRSLTLSPGEDAAVVFEDPELPQASALEVRLVDDDALSVDDSVHALQTGRRRVRALIVGGGGELIKRALSLPFVDVAEARESQAGYDLYVFNRVAPDELPAGNVVLIAPPRDVGPIRLGDVIERPDIYPVRGQVLMRSVDLTDIGAMKARELHGPDDMGVLAAAGGKAVICSWSDRGGGAVCIGFDPAESNWPLKPSFPIFWMNIAQEMGGGPAFAFVRTGEPVEGAAAAQVALRAGVHKVGESAYAANLLDRGESAVGGEWLAYQPGALDQVPGVAALPQDATTELTPWAVAVALICLVLYWRVS